MVACRAGSLLAVQSALDEAHRVKAAVSEKFAVLDAEYRTYKQCCNSPNNIAEQLQELLNLEAVKASAQSRVAAAEVPPDLSGVVRIGAHVGVRGPV